MLGYNYKADKEVAALLEVVRPVKEEDRGKLPKVSHSKLERMVNCPFSYDLNYNQGLRSSDSSLALELGTLLHYVLELKSYMLEKDGVNYEKLIDIIFKGDDQPDGDKSAEPILGVETLKVKYSESWEAPDSVGNTYDNKLKTFMERVLYDEMEDGTWNVWLSEHPFEFVFNDRVIISGFIDSVRKNGEDDIQCIDYKTSKKVFDEKKLKTSQQFAIYCMAILNEFGKLPVECRYDFILLDDYQTAFSSGWGKRAIKSLNKILDAIEEGERTSEWKPKPSPLCHWCNYCVTNPNAKEFNDKCPYYSLWTPENKTFSVNMKWGEISSPVSSGSTIKKVVDGNGKVREIVLDFDF